MAPEPNDGLGRRATEPTSPANAKMDRPHPVETVRPVNAAAATVVRSAPGGVAPCAR